MFEEGKVFSLNASAGSGKTTSIVQNMIQVLFQPGNNHKQLLGMTFTNKAANELKSKLLKVLSSIAKDESNIPLNIPGNPEEIKQKAYQLWIQILHDYNSLKISTLDKFFLSLIRSHSKELGINSAFKTELETEKIVEEAIQIIFKDSNTNPVLSKVLTQFALEKVREGKSWKIEFELIKMAQRLFSDEDFPYISTLIQYDFEQTNELLEQSRTEIIRFEQNMTQLHEEFNQLMEDRSWTVEDFKWRKKGFGGLGLRFEYAKKTKDYSKILNQYVLKQEETKEFGRKSERSYYDIQNCEEILHLTHKIIVAFQNYGKYLLYRSIRENMHSLSVLHVLALELQEIKLKKNLVLVSDINKLITSAQITQETNFLFWKLAERYKYYFLDEFQDTNVLQYINLMPLLKEVPANAQGNVWIVGDAKQAIYRWRGGNAEMVYKGLENDLSPEYKNLKSNWRSAPEIVKFNNALFSKIIEFPELQDITKHFSNIKQKPEKTNLQGSVEVLSLKPLKKNEEKTLTEISIDYCLAYIEDILSKTQVKLSDIAVIVRTNTEASLMAEALQKKSWAVRSSDALSLKNHPKVQCIIAALQFISHPDDTLALLEISALKKQLTETQEEINWSKSTLLGFEEKLAGLGKLSCIEAYEELIIVFEWFEESDAYLTRLGDVIREFCAEKSPTITDFLDWWSDSSEKIKLIQSGTEAIEILTVHKSKGLQFPVVILPFADWKVNPKPKTLIWFQSEQVLKNTPVLIPASTKLLKSEAKPFIVKEFEQTATDNLHLLYVALTRAEKHMFIVLREGIAENKGHELIENYKNCADWILRALPNTTEIIENQLYIKYQFGNIQQKEEIQIEEKLTEEHPKIYPISKHYKSKITLKRSSKEFWSSEESIRAEQMEIGLLIHKVFEYITNNQSVDSAIQQLIYQGYLTSEQAQTLQTPILNWIQHPEIEFLFKEGWEVLNEREFLNNHQVYRPDRVQLNQDKLVIMDYKTGKIREEDVEQISEYLSQLKKLYPKHQCEACLIYLSLNEVKWIR